MDRVRLVSRPVWMRVVTHWVAIVQVALVTKPFWPFQKLLLFSWFFSFLVLTVFRSSLQFRILHHEKPHAVCETMTNDTSSFLPLCGSLLCLWQTAGVNKAIPAIVWIFKSRRWNSSPFHAIKVRSINWITVISVDVSCTVNLTFEVISCRAERFWKHWLWSWNVLSKSYHALQSYILSRSVWFLLRDSVTEWNTWRKVNVLDNIQCYLFRCKDRETFRGKIISFTV